MHAIVNEHLKTRLPIGIIAKTLVEHQGERLQCLPEIAGDRHPVLVRTIHEMMRGMTDDHVGDQWNYYTLSNGAFFMAPRTYRTFDLACENGFAHEVSADTAGIIACASAYSHLSMVESSATFRIAYQLLSLYIFQHPDAGIIRAALD
ncbi:antirestriction protein [Massilia sp. CCM 8734]|uniref:antirestriction protein n=1 Tax=Massilia sp. CCM 8734 TaxID=2609283 RepID=UPI00142384AF|nr:antirestriction protein [Massilia sp. CCM 8734]NHZ99022.1 antirestriction protein [Massilia sp. CCM 8734]